jgi:hypothetical protein
MIPLILLYQTGLAGMSCFRDILTGMSTEITLSRPLEALPEAPHAASDDQLLEIWLHGRSIHTQRAYRVDMARFRARAGKPLPQITLADLQEFANSLGDLAPASRYRTLSAIKSLLGLGGPMPRYMSFLHIGRARH